MIYECSIMGGFGGSTIFRGKPSPFADCTGNPNLLSLPHSQFDHESQDVIRTCNDDAVIGRSISIQNGTYTSQLSITITSELLGDTIQCIHNNGRSLSEVGSSRINNTGIDTIHLSIDVVV